MNKFLCAVILFSALGTTSFAQTKTTVKAKPAAAVVINPMKNLNDSFSYAAGVNIAQSMKQQGVTEINGKLLQQAISDVLNEKKCLLTDEQASITLQQQLQAYAEKKQSESKAAGIAFRNEYAKNPKVTTLPNGLQYEIITAGEANGYMPKPVDTVVVHYAGNTIDGKEFDNSYKRGEAATFPLNRVITGWTEILGHMTKGAKWKVVIPSELGYGEGGTGAIPPGATLVFIIELLDILPAS